MTTRRVAFKIHNLITFPLQLHRSSLFPLLPSKSLSTFSCLNPPKTLAFYSSSSSPFRRQRTTVAAMVTATASPPPSVQVKDEIDLTDKESQIFNRLLEVLRHFSLDTQLRVAGGWVRDKLLGKDCYDIHIAIDNMMGKEFCEKVNEYLSSTGQEVQGVHVIQSNPEQSKHLETAQMKLFDMWVDFVNLRSEEYCETSRIPTMRFGTAEEDAYRRDLTINRFLGPQSGESPLAIVTMD